ncbi:hypothetical protein JL720_10756 [Aureococcus anophagefferens]|nr:hypothetical protein JL720_10756 [Aureococcus anophagefferens]
MDWDIIKRLVGCADDGGAALTHAWTSGESKTRDVTGALGSLWNVGVKASLLDGSESTEVGFEDPERADDTDECVAWTLNAVVGHDVFDGSTPLEEPTEPETADAKDAAVTPPLGCRKPNKTQLEWVGFDDDGAVWQVDDIRYDEKEKQYLLRLRAVRYERAKSPGLRAGA